MLYTWFYQYFVRKRNFQFNTYYVAVTLRKGQGQLTLCELKNDVIIIIPRARDGWVA